MKSEHEKQKVLVVEDDPEVMACIKALLDQYETDMNIVEATDAGTAMALLQLDAPKDRPHAIITDVMMPYGSANTILQGDSDLDVDDTGKRLVEHIREVENRSPSRSKHGYMWIAVITARANPALIQEIEGLIDGWGRVYLKPFDPIVFEHDLVTALRIPSNVPKDFLPPGYQPPRQQNRR